jgi:peptidoglycan/xylan/chitin deacetylase (PgdA/CDA1 family)
MQGKVTTFEVDKVSQTSSQPRPSGGPAKSGIGGAVRGALKTCWLLYYVFVWARLRNSVLSMLGRCRTTVLLYHRVNDDYRDSVTVGVEQFGQQIDMIQRSYRVIDLKAFLASKGSSQRSPSVVITFDDGYRDNYHAAEILRKRRSPATFFVSTRIVGNESAAFAHDMQRLGHRVPALSWDQVREMAEWGFEFGSHTCKHENVAQMQVEQALDDIATSLSDLKREVPSSNVTTAFAYPFGKRSDITDGLRARLSKIGVNACLSAYGGVNSPEFDILDVRRQPIDFKFSNLAVRAAIEGWSPRR